MGTGRTLRDAIWAEEAGRARVDVDDPAVLGDLDTPADLGALRAGSLPRFIRARAAPLT